MKTGKNRDQEDVREEELIDVGDLVRRQSMEREDNMDNFSIVCSSNWVQEVSFTNMGTIEGEVGIDYGVEGKSCKIIDSALKMLTLKYQRTSGNCPVGNCMWGKEIGIWEFHKIIMYQSSIAA